ncbi:C40 family peptidase [Cohnella suwonensis]|uniref:C40 family peptidase n=1 Tax=Cohnella suwonensis TaxID=696072 RepID=A0ABW0LRI3_9BACL
MGWTKTWLRRIAVVGLSATIAFVGAAVGGGQRAEAAQAASKTDKIISLGKQYMGVKYKFGATPGSTKSFDCSSFTQYVFGKIGIKLPRVSSSQATKGVKVARKNLIKGDLVFFRVARTGNKIGHVAIYIGNNKILHTYRSTGVTISSLGESYWNTRYVTARRVL